MPLTLRLEPRKKIIINGAVIENMGAATSIVVHNTANILKGKDVLTETDANTPARRVYYAVQCLSVRTGAGRVRRAVQPSGG
jgi:flagellar protein FlbT